jgi:hypothetical protein
MPDNGLHPTADTAAVMLRYRCGAAGDVGRKTLTLAEGKGVK